MRVFRIDNEDHRVKVQPDGDALKVTIDGAAEPFVLRRDHRGAWTLPGPAGSRTFWAHAGRDHCRVFSDGRVFEFAMPDPDLDDTQDESLSGPRLVADMPGKVVKILVAVGDAVAAGQPLVIMESMKMETELLAAVAGTVCGIAAEAGQVVGQGDLLVEVEPAEEG